jgi:hypothetical protein
MLKGAVQFNKAPEILTVSYYSITARFQLRDADAVEGAINEMTYRFTEAFDAIITYAMGKMFIL